MPSAEILAIVFGTLTPTVILLALIVFFPEKIEKWASMFWRTIKFIGICRQFALRKYIKHDLQGRMNDFVKGVRKRLPELPSEKLEIQWVDPKTRRQSFIENGSVVLRLHSTDPKDWNFVHGAFLYISTVLLYKAKRFLSPSQRNAIDLFFCSEFLKKEKPETVDFFLAEYLHPMAGKSNSKISNYLDDFAQIDRNDLFVNIFLKELHYLGDKVFGRKKDSQIISEVDGLLEFLKPISNRTIGEVNTTPHFNGIYCKFGISIIGKPQKLHASLDPYISFIKNIYIKNGIETIYLLSRAENYTYLIEICQPFLGAYRKIGPKAITQVFRYDEGRTERVKCCLTILRKKDINLVVPSRF